MVVDILGISPCDNIYVVVSKIIVDFEIPKLTSRRFFTPKNEEMMKFDVRIIFGFLDGWEKTTI